MMNNNAVSKVGFWAAISVIVFTVIFAVSILPIMPRSFLSLSFLSSFLLAISFMVMMTAVHYITPDEAKIWSHIALALAIVYAALNTSVYYIQLVVVRTNSLNLPENFVRPLTFLPGTPLFAIDMLGYGFLTLSTFFAAFAFTGGKIEAWIRRLFVLHGLLVVPTLIFPALVTYEPPSKVVKDISGNIALLGWSIVFLPGIVLVARVFRQRGR